MTTISISTLSLSSAPRASIAVLQDQLRDAQKEVVTGRFADVGESLGVRSGHAISLRSDRLTIERTIESNTVIAQRFDLMQASLASIAETAQGLMESLLSNGTNEAGIRASVRQAAAGLSQLTAAMNVSSGSRYLFSGATTDQPAIDFTKSPLGTESARDYFDGSTAQAAVADAVDAAGGLAGIDADQLTEFLDGAFSDLFSTDAGGGWGEWSTVQGTPVLNTISEGEQVNTSFGADNPAFRNIAKAYVMLADLGVGDMNEAAQQTLVNNAITTLDKGLSQMTEMRAEIGASQNRVENVQDTLKSRQNVIVLSIASLEDVDSYEASTRVTTLMNQLEGSYALTARISRLSLLNYL